MNQPYYYGCSICITFLVLSILAGCTTLAGSRKESPQETEKIEGMLFIKGGCFDMGDTFSDGDTDEGPAHKVCVDDFYIGETEVTQGKWREIMGKNPSRFRGPDLPVEQVNWGDVQEFIGNLRQKTGRNYRLPTEAEWEYAARSGGKKEKWAGTSSDPPLGEYAWNMSNSGNKTHPVKQKRPNGLGLYDMSGNVAEWVSDLYEFDYYERSPKDNPKGPSSGQRHVYRGGSYDLPPRSLRTTQRFPLPPEYRLWSIGLRLAISTH